MSWAYMDDTGMKCLMKMRKVNPNMIMICIGESGGGCTADMDDALEIMEEETANLNKYFQRFWGIRDYVSILK